MQTDSVTPQGSGLCAGALGVGPRGSGMAVLSSPCTATAVVGVQGSFGAGDTGQSLSHEAFGKSHVTDFPAGVGVSVLLCHKNHRTQAGVRPYTAVVLLMLTPRPRLPCFH